MSEKIDIPASSVFANFNNDSAYKIVDGNSRTKWVGGQFPGYVDIKLDGIYKVDKIVLDCPKNDICIFSVFASRDFLNFSEIVSQSSETSRNGHYELSCSVSACALRFLLKYESASSYAVLKNIEIFGCSTGERAEKAVVDFPENFEQGRYSTPVDEGETKEALYGIVERTIGAVYKDHFSFSVTDSDEEFFELSDTADGKLLISANSGASAAAGLNYYYKYFCGVHISQVGNNTRIPQVLPKINKPLKMTTPFKVRYSYNYCALSYTMAFWDEEEWQKELDYLALQGVNVILDITAIEEVWRRFLMKIGYSLDEALAFIPGPAYYAWFNMANIYGLGSPLPVGFFKKRTELARKNHRFMKAMGMSPVLQGFSGMVPTDIKKYVPDAVVIPQGLWNGAERPYMLKTDTKAYTRMASLFYECQREVFGDVSKYYATDPFHEGGRSGRLDIKKVSKNLLDSILAVRPDGVWIIQSWGENPSKELLLGVADRKEHTLILDLYAEKKPRWENFLGNEFLDSPWVYCMLNNFGGRMGLHGHLATIASEIARASNKAKHMTGIGITPEATHSNPIIFDLFFEAGWTKTEKLAPIDLEKWLRAYAQRRYGSCDENLFKAMLLLNETVYNPKLNEHGEGAPESIINARPSLNPHSPSTWGNDIVAYDKKVFEKAVKLFLSCTENCKAFEGYVFDAVDLLKQVLSNTAQEYHKNMVESVNEKDLIAFMRWSDKFLALGHFADEILSFNSEFTLGNWLNKAKKLAEPFDGFTAVMFEFNARALITTWGGSRQISEDGKLRDYSNKQWSGLTNDLYVRRWEEWIKMMRSRLNGRKAAEPDWFTLDLHWVWQRNSYTDKACTGDLVEAGKKVLSSFCVSSAER